MATNFWDRMTQSMGNPCAGYSFSQASGQEAPVLNRTYKAGQRVRLIESAETFLMYSKPPAATTHGTVVMVKTSSGKATTTNGFASVQWDDGQFLPVHVSHLQGLTSKRASKYAYELGNSSLLDQFLKVAGQEDELVHKASRDLWAIEQDGQQVRIMRLFSETGTPLKV